MVPNWSNRTLFHADNLAVMRGMNTETVDLIATDPPFNKGRDFHATPDSLAAGGKFSVNAATTGAFLADHVAPTAMI